MYTLRTFLKSLLSLHLPYVLLLSCGTVSVPQAIGWSQIEISPAIVHQRAQSCCYTRWIRNNIIIMRDWKYAPQSGGYEGIDLLNHHWDPVLLISQGWPRFQRCIQGTTVVVVLNPRRGCKLGHMARTG
ncbi:hypothetical protein BGX38DRAFT_733724 [Terfezia claveryi]|nr:hypothetical protein BGX38DRAFT_491166 [Terfezia claveryi]KAF8444191.1 hypothetical protein BGX38DRAFT_733724 [Terfezia claveryi]